MTKFASKEMALEAKKLLETILSIPNLPNWIKAIELDTDDHGYFLTTKINNRQDYISSNIKIPSTINVGSFNLKNCILVLG